MVAVELARHASRAGHEIAILSLTTAGGLPRRRAEEYGIEVINFNRRIFSLSNIRRLRKICAQFDVIHLHLWQPLYLALLAQIGSPIVYTEHSTSNRRQSLILARGIERIAYRLPGIIVGCGAEVSKSLCRYLISLGIQTSVRTVENGAAQRFFGPAQPRTKHLDERLRLVTVGTLNRTKNFNYAINYLGNIPGVDLDIFGYGPLQSELESMIKDGDVSNIKLRGISDDIAGELNHYHAYLSTSLFEGSPLTILEARARGLGVIGPDVPGVSGYIRDAVDGYKFSLDDEGVSLKAVVQKLQAEGTVEKFSRESIALRGDLSFSKTYEEYESLYEQVIEIDHEFKL